MKRISLGIGYLLLCCLTLVLAKPDVSELSAANGNNGDGLSGLRNSIQGEPEQDYPIFSEPPETSFTCDGKEQGYYADVEARCQVFRVCANTDLTGKGFKFLCPNGTLFNQQYFVCDWYHNVDCSKSAQYFGMNAGKEIGSIPEMMQMVKKMQDFPMQGANGAQPVAGQGLPVGGAQRGQVPAGKATGGQAGGVAPANPGFGNGGSQPFNGNNGNGGNVRQGPGNGVGGVGGGPGNGPNGNNLGGGNRLGGNGNGNGNLNAPTGQNGGGSPQQGSGNQLQPGGAPVTGNGKVYINKFGQLSTDPDSGFNPQTATFVKTDTGSLQPSNLVQTQAADQRVDYLPPSSDDTSPGQGEFDVRFGSNSASPNQPDNRYNQAQLLQENFPASQSNQRQQQPQQQQGYQQPNSYQSQPQQGGGQRQQQPQQQQGYQQPNNFQSQPQQGGGQRQQQPQQQQGYQQPNNFQSQPQQGGGQRQQQPQQQQGYQQPSNFQSQPQQGGAQRQQQPQQQQGYQQPSNFQSQPQQSGAQRQQQPQQQQGYQQPSNFQSQPQQGGAQRQQQPQHNNQNGGNGRQQAFQQPQHNNFGNNQQTLSTPLNSLQTPLGGQRADYPGQQQNGGHQGFNGYPKERPQQQLNPERQYLAPVARSPVSTGNQFTQSTGFQQPARSASTGRTTVEIVPSIQLDSWHTVSTSGGNSHQRQTNVNQRQGHSFNSGHHQSQQSNYQTQQFQASGSTHQQVYSHHHAPALKSHNEKVVVKVIPTNSYNLNDPIDRGLLNNIISQVGYSHQQGDVYANDIQSNGKPQIVKLRETGPTKAQSRNLFVGHSSYNVPLYSVGRLPCDGNGFSVNRPGCQ